MGYVRTQSNVGAGAIIAGVAGSGAQLVLRGARFFGEQVGQTFTTEMLIFHCFQNNGATGVTGPLTMESTNTRSPTPGAAYGTADNGVETQFIDFKCNACVHQAITFSGLYAPVAGRYANDGQLVVRIIDTVNVWFEESDSRNFRRPRRRTTKRGQIPFFSNQMSFVDKTGGGSFHINVPRWENNFVFLEPSAWRMGMHQSDVWNINLMTATHAPTRTLMGAGR